MKTTALFYAISSSLLWPFSTYLPFKSERVSSLFREFLEGKNLTEIKEGLISDGIKSPSGQEKWYTGTIKSMLQNEKYMGDLLLQKWYIKDFISKQAVKNNGRFPKYYVQNAHPPVVPREVFMQVKGEFLRREHERVVTGKRSIQNTQIPLYEKLVCCECGNTYQRFNGGTRKANWRCRTRIMKGTLCPGRIVKEKEAEDAVVKAFQGVAAFNGGFCLIFFCLFHAASRPSPVAVFYTSFVQI